MGSAGSPGDFDIHKFFKNPQPSGFNKPLPGFNPPQNPYPPVSPYHNFPVSGSYNASTGPYPNLSASYPFVSQGSMYNQYPPYPQDQGPHIPPYPAPGFSHPGFSSPMAQSLSGPSLHQSINSSNPSPSPSPTPTPALDSARLMALLTNQPSTKGVSTSLESRLLDSQTLDAYPKVSQFPVSAIPSAPPVSLAPVSSSTRLASSKTPKGRHLKGEYVVYDIDTRLSGEAQPQLEASTITKYFSDPQLVLGRQIAVNVNYICYGLRANRHIRVLNTNNALRNLLRGHSERVTDMEFFSEDVHLLASASSDGRVFVRRIEECPGEDNKLQIADHILLAIQFSGNWESVHPRICWHADSTDVLVVGINKYIITIDIERVKQTAAPGGFVAEEPVLCNVDRPIEGIYCSTEHEDEITDISSCYQSRSLLASASKDGTVRLWTDPSMFLCGTLTPHSGLPVGAVSFLAPSHHADHIVLVTAGPLNRELKLWVPSGEEGWFPTSGSVNWKCIQTLEFKSSLGGSPEDSFFNQVLVVSKASLILLANAKKNALYVVHVDYGSSPSATRMDYLAEFSVTMPILSITATGHNTSYDDGILHFYCVQTQAIQQYSLDLSLCVPPLETSTFTIENNVKAYNIKHSMDTQPSSGAYEVSSMLREQSPGPISGISLTEESVSDDQFSSANVEQTLSNVRLLIGSSKKEPEDNELSVNIPTIIAPIPHVGPVTLSPRGSSVAKLSVKSPKLSTSPQEQEYVRVFEQTSGELESNPDLYIPSSYPLSPKRSSNEIMRISEDRDWQVISTTTASSSSAMPEQHLVTPFELMSMAARMKGESEGVKMASPLEEPNIISEKLTESGSKVEDYIEKMDLDVLTVETKEVTDSNLVYTDDTSLENNLVVSDLRKEVNVVDRLLFEPSKESEEITREEQSGPVLDELCEQLKEVSVKIDDSSTLLAASRSRKKKNKNKTDANTPMAMMLPPTDIPESSVNAGEQGSVNVSSSNTFPSAIAAQINTLQDSFNQLVIMQREFQKQMGNLISIPVAKEVKSMEVTLGQRMEKLLKAQVDEIMVHLQEDNTKREIMERERTEQMTTMLSNIFNKDMPAAFERSAKKELASIGSSIARLVTPSIEKAISSAVSETFQKGISEKAIAQLDKSVGGKIEAILGKQLQTQFLTCGKQALQDGLASSLETSIIPGFERACQEMFGQVDATFQKGLSEYQMQVQKQMVSSHNALTTALQEAAASVTSIAATMKEDVADGQKKLLTLIENVGVARSMIPEKAMTVEHVEESLDPTKELARLVTEGKLEEAFNKALSRTDVGIVSWLCNQVDLATMCTMSPPPLSQGVLLSLVQQLGCDLGQDTGKKLMWIKDAALALNPHDPALAPHMRRFLEQLYSNLHALAKTPLTPELANSTRLVMHVVHSLLSVCK